MDNEPRDQFALAEEQNVKSMRTSFVHILTFCLPIATLVSCSNQPNQSQSETISTDSTNKSEMNTTDLQNFGQRYARAWCSQKPDTVAAFFSDSGSLTVNNGKTC
jgi:hypothetical protein